jgi:short-subunit dehydrogenase
MTFKNKVVVITGASAGVGRATAIAFAKEGAKIALLARGLDGLNGAKNEIEQLGGRANIYPVDVSKAILLNEVSEKIERELGPIDIWVNNAMCSVFAPMIEIEPDDYLRVTEVTYLGQVYGTMTALKQMQKRNQGIIVLIGSALAHRGIPLQSAYCGAKHAVQGFFESLRSELFHNQSGIHLTIVHMPALNTPQFEWVKSLLPNKPKPMGKVFQPEVAAQAILYAASHQRREIYVAFPTYVAIWGNKIAGWFLDRYLGKVGYKGQQTDEKVAPNRKNNVWEPVPGDHGAHGTFDKVAHNDSFMLNVTMHRSLIWTVVIILIAVIILILVISL